MSDLYLRIHKGNHEPFEIKCSCPCHRKDGSYASDYSLEREARCHHCHGTGTRLIQLEGLVEIGFEYYDVMYAVGTDIYVYMRDKDEDGNDTLVHARYGIPKILTAIIQAYRDGTLPDEIRSQLKEVSV